MSRSIKVFFVFFIINKIFSFGQSSQDSLNLKSFDELFELYNNESNFKKSEFYLKVWINKAKKEKDSLNLLTGYEIASLLYEKDPKRLVYLDSILLISLKNDKLSEYSASAYRMKGEYYYEKRKFKKELKNYLLAKKYVEKTNNKTLSFFIEYDIGLVKDRNGEHEEAIEIHKKNFNFSKSQMKYKFNYIYLQSIYAMANSYNYLNQLDSASFYNELGYKEAIKLDEPNERYYFILSQGITHFFDQKFKIAIDSLTKASVHFTDNKDMPNSSEAYYFLAKSYKMIGQNSLAIKYFKKVDTIFKSTGDLLPIIRDTYHQLINYAENNNNLKQQIDYTNQLIKLDSILYTNEIYINKNLIKEFDIPRLISNKEKLINDLKFKEKKSKLLFVILITLIVLFIYISALQFYKRRFYKRKFEEIIANAEDKKVDLEVKPQGIKVPEEIVNLTLSRLDDFEKNRKFTNKNLTLNLLAKDLDTNTNYLSKVINHFKGKSFSNYLSDLRINYIIVRLKEDSNLRKFTIKAIAEEAGFNNSESFSKAFFKIKGIKPSYFLRELDKLKDSK
ncbi:helix-turn-helix domain-containing protein [Tenacibaculum sp. MEBiC06402]|uniref:helix-turn-helix domain-containing protein n=1 Tax=unclassified Tenacibaculum TaxID=2635139 RepID=UPI003B9D96F4